MTLTLKNGSNSACETYRKSGYDTSSKSQLANKILLKVTIHTRLNNLQDHVKAVATSEATKAAAQVNLFKHSLEQAYVYWV